MTLTAESRTELDRTRFYSDGEWVEPRGTQTHRAIEAATGDLLGTAALGTTADIDAAVRAALHRWCGRSTDARAPRRARHCPA